MPKAKSKTGVKPKRKSPAKVVAPVAAKRSGTTEGSGYEKYKEKQAGISRERSAKGREIGGIPPVTDPARRDRCRYSFRDFCETYLAEWFPLGWSADHLKAIAKIEDAVLRGGRFAFAMPRGSGKTTLCQAAVMWALHYGHRVCVVLIGATDPAAIESLDSIKQEIELNDLLLTDFPAVAYPIRCLDGIANRAPGQTLNGERTRIEWTDKELALPVVPGEPTSGAAVRVSGITGRIRGLKVLSKRPDLVIVDDPSTDESAHSLTQNNAREKVLAGAVLGLGGPKTEIACVMPCTVIAPGDMADRILDRDRHPPWQGERSKMVYAFPLRADLWSQYATIRADGFHAEDKGMAATDFYLAHREEMDAGAVVGWVERFPTGTVSAIQHAMNMLINDRASFMAEYQNEPEVDLGIGGVEDLDPDELGKKVNRVPRGIVAPDCTRLTAFVDCGGSVLWYLVAGWNEGFGGSVVDYGPFPAQNRAYFAAADARPALAEAFPGRDETARLYAGLKAVVESVMAREYRRQDGGTLRVELCMIDSGWQTDTVHQFCRQSPLSAILLPSKGYGIGAGAAPMDRWAKRPGERLGECWRLSQVTTGGRGRLAVFDTNHWKTFAAQRLVTPEGSAGCVQLHGEADTHQLLCDHLTSEYRVRTEGRGRQVDEWKMRPGRVDNHLWDCYIGACVAASIQGVKWSAAKALGLGVEDAAKGKSIKLSDIQKQKREAKQ